MPASAEPARAPTPLVKRYGGGRLYRPDERRYVSLDEVRAWVGRGIGLRVVDAATGEDVTRAVLA